MEQTLLGLDPSLRPPSCTRALAHSSRLLSSSSSPSLYVCSYCHLRPPPSSRLHAHRRIPLCGTRGCSHCPVSHALTSLAHPEVLAVDLCSAFSPNTLKAVVNTEDVKVPLWTLTLSHFLSHSGLALQTNPQAPGLRKIPISKLLERSSLRLE